MRYRPRRRRRHRRGMGDTSAGDRGMGLGLSRKSRRRRRSIGGRIRRTGCARVPRFINSRWRNLTQCISSPLLHGRSINPGPPPPCSADSWNFSWHNDFRRNTSSPSPSIRSAPNTMKIAWRQATGEQSGQTIFNVCARVFHATGIPHPVLRAQEFRDRFFHPCDSANRIFRDASPVRNGDFRDN